MNDANRESIMKMVSEGTLRPEEAAKLLARLTEDEEAAAKSRAQTKASDEAKEKAEKAQSRDGERSRFPPRTAGARGGSAVQPGSHDHADGGRGHQAAHQKSRQGDRDGRKKHGAEQER